MSHIKFFSKITGCITRLTYENDGSGGGEEYHDEEQAGAFSSMDWTANLKFGKETSTF